MDPTPPEEGHVSESYRDKLRSVGVLTRGRTRPRVVEGRDVDGNRTKAVTDELGNTVTEHNNHKDQVDVHIRAPHVRITSQEVPHDG